MNCLSLTNLFVVVIAVCCLGDRCHGELSEDKMKTINILVESLREQRAGEMNTFEALKDIALGYSAPGHKTRNNNNNKLVYHDMLRIALNEYLNKHPQVPAKRDEETFHLTNKDDSARMKKLAKVELVEKKATMMEKKLDDNKAATRNDIQFDEKELDVLDDIYSKLRDDSVTLSKLSMYKIKLKNMLEKLKKDSN